MDTGTDRPFPLDEPLTVVIPWWDRPEEWLIDAVESVRGQGLTVRILVIDNCSSVQPPSLEGVEVVRTPHRGTVGYARNLGLGLVRSDTVIFLDADDRLLPGSLRYLVELLAEHPDAVGVQGSQLLWCSDTGEELPDPWPYPWMRAAQRALLHHRRAFGFLLATRIFFPIHGALLRTQAVRDAGGFADMRQAQDWSLAVSLALLGPLVLTEHPTYVYRRQKSIRTLHGELLAMDRPQRMAVRGKIRARLFNDPRATGWLRSRTARYSLIAIHYIHNFLVESYIADACKWTARRPIVVRLCRALARTVSGLRSPRAS